MPSFIRESVPLSRLTTFGIGGPARWLATPSTRTELAHCLEFAKNRDVEILILGGGSNLLVADAGVDALVLKLGADDEFGCMNPLPEARLMWRIGAAVSLPALVSNLGRRGIVGLEALAGIPGSVGGAVRMNCGGGDGCIGAFVLEAEVCDLDGEFRTMSNQELAFQYRGSGLAGSIAVEFVLRFLASEDPAAVMERIRHYRDRKKETQPVTLPSAGCVFRNPPGQSAGMLIDQAGCKGMREGDAEVSGVHANFIVNRGAAGSRDVAVLAGRVRDAVLRSSGVTLEPELDLWGHDPEFASLKFTGHETKV